MSKEEIECPYCGEVFDSEHEKGVHISEEHVNNDEIPVKTKKRGKDENIVSKWQRNNQN